MAKSTIKLNPIVGDLSPIHKTTAYTDIDTLIDEVFDGSGNQFVMLDNRGNLNVATVTTGNRQQIFGWFNAAKTYGQLLIVGLNGLFYAIRANSTTATITKIGG